MDQTGLLNLEAEVSDYQSGASVLIRVLQACAVGCDSSEPGAPWQVIQAL